MKIVYVLEDGRRVNRIESKNEIIDITDKNLEKIVKIFIEHALEIQVIEIIHEDEYDKSYK